MHTNNPISLGLLGVFCLSLALGWSWARAADPQDVWRSGTVEQVKAKDDQNRTPLLYAANENPNPDVIAALLKAGADLNAKDKHGKGALDLARAQNTKVVETLIKAGGKGSPATKP